MHPTRPNCSSPNSRPAPGDRRGSIILAIVMAIIVLGLLGVGMSRMVSTSHVEQGMAQPSPEAFYAAETGFRMLAAEFNAVSAAGREDVLEGMHGKTFVLDQASSAQVSLSIHSYWTRITAIAGNVLTVEALSKFPLQDMEDTSSSPIDLGSLPKISINRSQPIVVTGIVQNTGGSQDTAVITLASIPPLASAGDSVYLVQTSGNNVTISGNDLLGLPASFAFFPARNGQFYLYDGNDTVYEYDSMDVNPGTGRINLRGVTNLAGKSSSDFRSLDFILLKTVAISATGTYGQGGLAASKTVVYHARLKSDGSLEIKGALPDFILDAGFDDYDPATQRFLDWEANPKVTKQSYTSAQGDHIAYGAALDPVMVYDPDSGKNIKSFVMCLDKNEEFAEAWTNSTNSLSYDIQVKMGSGWLMLHGAMGITFKYHESASAGKYQGYGVSLMKYYTPTGSAAQDNPDFNDYIPEPIKPAGMGSPARSWRWENLPSPYNAYWAYTPCECTGNGNCNNCEIRDQPLSESIRLDRILLVLWKQYVSGGLEHRVWMAYKDISDDYYGKGKQWWGDGRICNDNFSLFIRCEELLVSGQKTNFIKVFYGDASERYPLSGSRTANANSYDILNLRGDYAPAWTVAGGALFPTWPPFNMETWNATGDYMSFIRKAPASYDAARGKACTWDAVNPAVSSDFTIMWDGGTIRSVEFLTPDTGVYPASRKEVCLHAYYNPSFNGYLNFANEAAAVDDFSLRVYKY